MHLAALGILHFYTEPKCIKDKNGVIHLEQQSLWYGFQTFSTRDNILERESVRTHQKLQYVMARSDNQQAGKFLQS